MKLGHFLKTNNSSLLVLGGLVAFGVTIYATVKATRKYDSIKEEKGEVSKTDLVKSVTPAVVAAATTIGTVAASHMLDRKQQRKLKDSIAMLQEGYSKFKTHLPNENRIEMYKNEFNLNDKIPFIPQGNLTENTSLYFDTLCGQYFYSTEGEITAAFYRTNKQMAEETYISLEDHYRNLGIKMDRHSIINKYLSKTVDWDLNPKDIGWDSSFGYDWIEPQSIWDSTTIDANGKEIDVKFIEYDFQPHLL